MVEEPSDPGEVNAIEADPSPGVATNEVGIHAVERGVTDAADAAAVPSPTAFTARSFTE